MKGKRFYEQLLNEIHKTIIDQEEVIELIVSGILSEGHILIEGVPGVGKTLLVNTISKALDLKFSRIQFTPDLMPSDIIGTEIIEEDTNGKKYFRFIQGPVFANVVLADEINRASPKTQSALLEVMQEKKVTAYGKTYYIERPFIIMATQNPIEQEGTYPLPEAQLDRFLMRIFISYPDFKSEMEISNFSPDIEQVKKIVNKEELIELQEEIKLVEVAEKVKEYVVKIIRFSRKEEKDSPDIVKEYVQWGASPRASQHLLTLAKTFAFLENSPVVLKKHVDKAVFPVLNHRLILSFRAITEGVKIQDIIEAIMKKAES